MVTKCKKRLSSVQFPLRAQDILTSSTARPRIKSVLNASSKHSDVIYKDTTKQICTLIETILALQKNQGYETALRKSRDYKTYITAYKMKL